MEAKVKSSLSYKYSNEEQHYLHIILQDDTIMLLDICIGRSIVGQAPKPWTVCNPYIQDVRGREVEAVMERYLNNNVHYQRTMILFLMILC
jgi:hypothetical protein